ncbi:MAG: transketolase [Proteobacteria bacterium]|nr:transketolase [Pseudomonadota bacterium]
MTQLSELEYQNDSIDLARKIRIHAIKMVAQSNSSHIGSSLSMADILAVLYMDVLHVDPKQPDWPKRDRFILSKGHAAAGLYATLALRGFFPMAWLERFCQEGWPLLGHVSHHVPGVELSTGSLGHGLPVCCGMALAGKRQQSSYRIFVILSDGECDEGSNWEAALFAAQHKLDNLVAIVDANKLQGFGRIEEVLALDPFAQKWNAFNWAVQEVDGHDHRALRALLQRIPFEPDHPSLVIAHTIKGKGVNFMEDQLAWHYKSPDPEQLEQALQQLGEKH